MTDSYEKPSILIVDDNLTNIKVLTKTLQNEGEIFASENGENALLKIEAHPQFDLIILDIMMPGMDGYEVCRILKQNEKTRTIPIIFVTAISEAVDEAKGFDLGAVDYVAKPFVPEVVRARVRTHIALKRKSDKLESLVAIDGLTEINNRRRFDEVLISEWRRAFRSQTHMSLLLLDIDYFKQYNDNYGHTKGDQCLKNVAGALQRTICRSSDFLARYGGEEFVVILPDTNNEGAFIVAERLIQAIANLKISHQYSTAADHLTISVGVASAQPHQINASPIELLETADKMLYVSKANGRNQINSTNLTPKTATTNQLQ